MEPKYVPWILIKICPATFTQTFSGKMRVGVFANARSMAELDRLDRVRTRAILQYKMYGKKGKSEKLHMDLPHSTSSCIRVGACVTLENCSTYLPMQNLFLPINLVLPLRVICVFPVRGGFLMRHCVIRNLISSGICSFH